VGGKYEKAVKSARKETFDLFAALFLTRDVGCGGRVAEVPECLMNGFDEGMIMIEVAPFGGMDAMTGSVEPGPHRPTIAPCA
jgi:hypothetical protein